MWMYMFSYHLKRDVLNVNVWNLIIIKPIQQTTYQFRTRDQSNHVDRSTRRSVNISRHFYTVDNNSLYKNIKDCNGFYFYICIFTVNIPKNNFISQPNTYFFN